MQRQMKCDYCGKEFVCQHKERLDHVHHFCSKVCEGAYKKQHNPNWIPCAVCGTLTYVKPSVQNSKHPHCCSNKCLAKLREDIYRGENNPNFGNRGNKNPIWKSDSRISSYGYILVRRPDHPFANCDGFVFEHRLVAEQFLLTDENSVEIDGKKYLSPRYDVHHIDGDKQNNNPSNLQVLTKGEHRHLHALLKQSASLNPEKSVKPTA